MEHDDDVERLFSWLKTPDLRYREFTGERARADAAAAWPGLRQPTTPPGPGRPEPVVGEPVIPEPPPESPPGPLSERLRAVLGRSGAPRTGQTFHDVVLPPAAEETVPPYLDAGAAFHDEEDHREPAPPVAPPPYEEAAVEEPPHEALYGGTYRGFENEEPAAVPAPPPEEEPGSRSLDGLFSRLARPGSGDHSDRRPRPGPSGLGPVFRRLR